MGSGPQYHHRPCLRRSGLISSLDKGSGRMLPSERRRTRYPSSRRCSATSNPWLQEPTYLLLTSTRVPGERSSTGAPLVSTETLTMALPSCDPRSDGILGALLLRRRVHHAR